MPARLFREKSLLVATHNTGKLQEIAALLAPYVEQFQSSADLGLAAPDETGTTFQDNAILKARAASLASGMVALADDSGLMVRALGGRPGIHTADWSGPNRDYTHAMHRVNMELGHSTDRAASFVCTLALAWPDGHVETVAGEVHGQIVWPPRGATGFGYDPIFVPEGHDETFAELGLKIKQRLSHRSAAFHRLVDRCFLFNDYNK